jgi:hypothetical protein
MASHFEPRSGGVQWSYSGMSATWQVPPPNTVTNPVLVLTQRGTCVLGIPWRP